MRSIPHIPLWFIRKSYYELFICWCKIFLNPWFIPRTVSLCEDIGLHPQLLFLFLLVDGDDTTQHPLAPVRRGKHCVTARVVEMATLARFLVAPD